MSSNGITNDQKLDALFPAPSLPPSALSPQRFPGGNIESLAALQHVFKDNHRRHHIFFNHTRFHNHITHRALALYALGGSASLIEGYYEQDGKNQRPAFESPEPINGDNFVEHLGDENCYQGYVAFFSKQIDEKGAAETLEEFVFSEKYNFREGLNAESQPEMLFRFMDGVIHPMIHAGYGVEFGIKGMLAEGLALAAVHETCEKAFFPRSFFAAGTTTPVDEAASLLSSLVLNAKPLAAPKVSKTGGVHAFDVMARMLKDDQFKPKEVIDFVGQYNVTLAKHAAEIRRYAEQWTVDLTNPNEIERKMEELLWVSSVLYAVGGFNETKGYTADFFLMHMVTSSLFLPSLVPYLSPGSQVLLLRSYFMSVLTWWVARGLPALNFKSFMTFAPTVPTVPNLLAPQTTTTETDPIPNPILPILQSTITHPNDHLAKIQRAFAHFNTLYSARPAGYFKGTELEDAELLDGSLFVRAAILTTDYMGWVREGQTGKMWSFEGFYDQWL
ncbi:hypothetical protein HYDPIDRAFT_167993 [Hydnomerulius pinastri MD-312]|uniref:Oxidoreductase AflY n=1 Tax=Hydnomerulius pinastri MD-312 TaxID=994086 RepID=A0A0C9WFL1_9AGAM|nr:hypothetical protein HYDPIDRAFT_167993 [Hydnomerulius pinastri MD-312]